MTVETNMNSDGRNVAENKIDWNRSSYFRTASSPNKGDYFTFQFNNPFKGDFSLITGSKETGLNTVNSATVEVSENGVDFTESTELENGNASIQQKNQLKL